MENYNIIYGNVACLLVICESCEYTYLLNCTNNNAQVLTYVIRSP